MLSSSSLRAVLTCCPGQRLLVQQMLSAACAAAFSSTIMNPLDIARTRIQVSGMQAAASGRGFDCYSLYTAIPGLILRFFHSFLMRVCLENFSSNFDTQKTKMCNVELQRCCTKSRSSYATRAFSLFQKVIHSRSHSTHTLTPPTHHVNFHRRAAAQALYGSSCCHP